MAILGRAVSIVSLLLLVAVREATAQAREIRIDRIVVGAGRAIDVAATDSNVVIVTVDGGKYPLVAQSTAEAARRWVVRVDSIALSSSVAARKDGASERNEFGTNSDILNYAKVGDQHGRRDAIAIDIGPNNMTMYSADVPSSLLGRLTASMLRAARVTDSLTPPAKRCLLQSGMPPMDYSGPSGYASGTNLDRVMQPPLRAGSPTPVYPASAEGARIVGNVVASFVIDTAGRPIIETFRLRGAANSLFVRSVCDALPLMRFVPSIVNGRAVPQLVGETFVIPPQALRR